MTTSQWHFSTYLGGEKPNKLLERARTQIELMKSEMIRKYFAMFTTKTRSQQLHQQTIKFSSLNKQK